MGITNIRESSLYIISYYTYKDDKSLVAGLRPYRLYEFLLEQGVDTHLVTPQSCMGKELIVTEGWFLKGINFLSRILPPDATILWSIKVFIQVIWPNRKENISILTSLPPNGTAFCGLLCKWLNLDCIWILDFRDLWTDHPLYNPPITKKYIDPILERLFVKKADLLICNTDWDRRFFATKFSDTKTKKVVIRNGFDSVIPNVAIVEPQTFRFIYTGGTTAGQATLKIINLLESLNKEGFDVHCDFYGEYDENMDNSKFITYHGTRNSDEIPYILINYKYGFIYLPENSETGGRVAQKFYDYLGAGVIPVCFRTSVEMNDLMTSLNTGVSIGDNYELKNVIYDLTESDFNASTEQIAHYSRNNQFNIMLIEVNEIFKK